MLSTALIESQLQLAIFHFPSGPEWIVVLVIGLLIFGKNLPQVGRSLGRSIIEFKKGLKGLEDDLHKAEHEADQRIDKQLPGQKDPAQLT